MSDIDYGESNARALLSASAARARSLTDLAVAEVRLAAVSSLNMLLLVLLSAGALMMAWGLLVVCCLQAAAVLGVPWGWAALALAAAHAVLAVFFWRGAVRLSNALTLPELRRSLTAAEREASDARRASIGASRQAAAPASS